MRTFILAFLLLPTLCLADSLKLKSYADEFLSFEYPTSFNLSKEEGEDGFIFITLVGPSTTSLIVFITPEPYSYDLEEMSNDNHAEMIIAAQEASGNPNIENSLIRKVDTITMSIGGNDHPGIRDHYSGTGLFDKSTFQSSLSIVYSQDHTYYIQEERRNEFIEKHETTVMDILNSIKFLK